MPCFDAQAAEADRNCHKEVKRLRERCDMLARLLCEAMQIVEGSEDTSGRAIEGASKELRSWWKEHKKFDEARKR